MTSRAFGSDWSPGQRGVFRAAFAYFGLFLMATLFDVAPSPRRLLATGENPIVNFVGHSLLRRSGNIAGRGAAWAFSQEVSAILLAIVVAAIWSMVARRTEYDRLNGWFRIGLRYYVGVIMMIYGGAKVVPSQFPPIALDQLAQPLGALPPMGLLWAYMGYSPVYAVFAGLGEFVGAFLLFFRRTTTAGALILVAVLSNVVLLNYQYDVPVKLLSTNLLLGAVVLAAADARRLISVFFLNTPVPAADVSFPFSARALRIRKVVRPVVIVLAFCAPLVASFFVRRFVTSRSPLYGVYEVERFTKNGATYPPLTTADGRWRSIVFGRPGTMSVRLMTDSVWFYATTVDTVQHHLVSSSLRGNGPGLVLDYQRLSGNAMRLYGLSAGDTIDVLVHRLDEQKLFRLLAR